MSAIFPGAVATPLQLLTAINNTKVTLNADAGVGDTTFTVDDASPLPASGYLTFDDHETSPETIFYTGISGANLTGVTRGADGTSAGSHVSGAHLEQRFNAAYHNVPVTEIVAVEQYLSDRFGIGASPVIPSTKTLTIAATSNQLVVGTTNTTTVSFTAPAASRTYTVPDAGGAASFVMSAGTQTIAGAKTFSTAVVISATTNQIVLGVTNTLTITSPAPASSAVYTIPDVGTTASFVMTAGTQTIAGAKTFSSSVTISGNNGLVINDGEGTPKTVTIKTPATLTATYTLTLPVDAGTSGYVLSTNGSGVCSWIATSGTVNSGTAGNVAYYASSTTAVSTTGAFTVGANGPNGIIVGTNTNDNAAAGYVGEYISSSVSDSAGISSGSNGQYADITSISLTAGDWSITAQSCIKQNGATITGFEGGVSTTAGNSVAGMSYGDNLLQISYTGSGSFYGGVTISHWRLSLSAPATTYLKASVFFSGGTPKIFGTIRARRIR